MKPSLQTFAKVPNIIRETCLQDASRFTHIAMTRKGRESEHKNGHPI